MIKELISRAKKANNPVIDCIVALYEGRFEPGVCTAMIREYIADDEKAMQARGIEPIHCAVALLPDTSMARLLVEEAGADINAWCCDNTPLSLAVLVGKSVDFVKELLDMGAKMQPEDNVLFYAWQRGDEEMMTLLLHDAGVDIAKALHDTLVYEEFINKEYVKYLISAGAVPSDSDVILAVIDGETDLVAMLLDARENKSLSPEILQEAVIKDNVEIVRMLLALPGAGDCVNDSDESDSPLAHAIRCNTPEIARLLLEAGADLVPFSEVYEHMQYDDELAQVLREFNHKRGDVIEKRETAATCRLFEVIHTRNWEKAVSELREQGANVSGKDEQGKTLVQHVIDEGEDGVRKLNVLLDKWRWIASDIDDNGDTPLMYALKRQAPVCMVERLIEEEERWGVRNDQGEDVRALARKYTGPADLRDMDAPDRIFRRIENEYRKRAVQMGKSRENMLVLDPAIKRGATPEEIAALIDAGADVNDPDAEGMSPLMLAAARGDVPLIRLLLKHGADVKAENVVSAFTSHCMVWTVLMYAVKAGHEEAVRVLLEAGAPYGWYEINAFSIAADQKVPNMGIIRALLESNRQACSCEVDQFGRLSPLMLAAWSGNIDLMSYLVEHGSDVNEQNSDHVTPLMAAAYRGGEKAVKWLLERGVHVNVQDRQLKTALDYARSSQVKQCLRNARARKRSELSGDIW